MELLPPTHWSDFATTRDLQDLGTLFRADLQRLETKIDGRFEAMEHRFDAMEHRFDATEHRFDAKLQTALNRQTMTLLPGMAALLAVFAAVSSLV